MLSTQNRHRLKASVLHISRALAVICTVTPVFAQVADPSVSLGAVSITAKIPVTLEATETAPSQGSLEARSAVSIVGDAFVRDFTSPVGDYTQAVTMAPGVFAFSPNGVGLGDSKLTMRGLPDSFWLMSFDGIPFNDTNGVSHHSWVFFPTQFLGGAVVDRSPGSASTIGQATFGGSIDLRSRILPAERSTSVTTSMGSWNTKLVNLEHATGQFGPDGGSNLLFNVQEMKSDGYQTYNKQDRTAYSAKFEQIINSGTKVTAFSSALNLKNNTPNIKGVTRANYNAGNYTSLLSNDPARADYFGYNFYDIDTTFNYVGITSDLGGGWKVDDKAYRYSYYNKQNYNGTTITSTSAVDKLNAYVTFGNILRLSRDTATGTLRTGLWVEQANSHRYQIPSDPRTWVDAPSPNFNESYKTISVQPFLEYAFKVNDKLTLTPGVKYARYKQDFTHLQDNGGAVGPLGGVYNNKTGVITGGAASMNNGATYSDWLPSFDAHYKIQPNWTTYAQYAMGDEIPSTSVFDTPNKITPLPKATRAKTLQVGTVWNSPTMMLAADIYHTKLDGAYTPLAPDAFGNIAYVLSGTEVSQGVEAEANFALGHGFSLYVNGTIGSLKYANGQWVAGAPKDTQTVALNYQRNGWAASLSANRIGSMYNDGKDGSHQAFTIDPVVLTNLFVNYTIKEPMGFIKQTKLQLGVNNLLNSHSVVGIASPAAGSTSATPLAADLLTVLPGRSINATATFSF